ncbi:MAG: DUF4381 domain-containing protein [Rhodanobacteraceae bacterium]|nr:MAG: DUF4381 domain-containing protein [Rhodanobacteraceae bacterium]
MGHPGHYRRARYRTCSVVASTDARSAMNGPALRDIHIPAAAWWPLAPGWWLLLGVLALACAGVVLWRAGRAQRGPLRAALREIDALEARHARDGDDACVVDGASRLMRRVARRIEPVAASRSGDAWRAFVHRYARDEGARGALDRLAEIRFHAQPSVDAEVLITALRAWCSDALRGRVSTPFGTKGVGAKRRGDVMVDKGPSPSRAARAFASLRPSFRRGKQTPFGKSAP